MLHTHVGVPYSGPSGPLRASGSHAGHSQACHRHRRGGRSRFDLCHLLGFRLASRICDLNERRLYGLSLLDPWPTLRPFVAAPVTVSAIEADCVETLRLAASIRAVTVSASVMLRKLAGFSRQNSVARALLEIGRIERTLSCSTGLTIPNSGVAPVPSSTRVKPRMCSPALSS